MQQARDPVAEPTPCPFCGCARIGCHFKKSGRAKSGYQCECLGCGIRQGRTFHPSISAAVEMWNTRSNVKVSGPASEKGD